jgi:hypothetical protein
MFPNSFGKTIITHVARAAKTGTGVSKAASSLLVCIGQFTLERHRLCITKR